MIGQALLLAKPVRPLMTKKAISERTKIAFQCTSKIILAHFHVFKWLGKYLRQHIGVAKTLRFWEFYISIAWQGQTIAFWVLTIIPSEAYLQDQLTFIPTWLSSSIGLMLIILGRWTIKLL